MSSAPSPRGKPAAATDVDSIMPLLFATIGNPSISFKKMAAMDPENRTESSLEHKFRKWRQKGREIAEKNPEHAGSFGADTPKKSRGSTAKSGGNGKAGKKQNPEVTDDEPNNDEDWLAAVKCEEGDDVSEQLSQPLAWLTDKPGRSQWYQEESSRRDHRRWCKPC